MGRRHEPQEALGRAVRELRGARGLTQVELARAADTNSTAISHLERGRTNPAWGTMRRIASALGVSMSEVAALAERLEREGAPARPTPRASATARPARHGRSRPRP